MIYSTNVGCLNRSWLHHENVDSSDPSKSAPVPTNLMTALVTYGTSFNSGESKKTPSKILQVCSSWLYRLVIAQVFSGTDDRNGVTRLVRDRGRNLAARSRGTDITFAKPSLKQNILMHWISSKIFKRLLAPCGYWNLQWLKLRVLHCWWLLLMAFGPRNAISTIDMFFIDLEPSNPQNWYQQNSTWWSCLQSPFPAPTTQPHANVRPWKSSSPDHLLLTSTSHRWLQNAAPHFQHDSAYHTISTLALIAKKDHIIAKWTKSINHI